MFINMIFYPTFKDQAAELQKSFESLPDTAVQLFGGSTDFFSPVGFLNSQIFFIMLPLLLGILAINLGSTLIAREEQDHTIEGLLARPISRSKLLFGKVVAGLLQLSIVTFVTLFVTVVIARAVLIDVPVVYILAATFACYILAVSLGAIAFLLTAIGRTRGLSLGIGTVVALGGYIISSLAGTVTWLKTPSYVFPFHYYKSEAILRGNFNWTDITVLLAVIIVCGVGSWIAFRRRDLS
jgi:ABC-2 type transport system permease protein